MVPMGFFGFLVKVVAVSAPAVLSPGPLTVATASLSVKRGWRSGLWVAVGHTLVELPLVLAIGFGVGALLTVGLARFVTGLMGGIFLLIFGLLTFRDAFRYTASSSSSVYGSPLLVGVGLSGLNPSFITWWVCVGSALIVEALTYHGFSGVFTLFAAHVWLDYAWLCLVAKTAAKLSGKSHRVLLLVLASLTMLFGLDFTYAAIRGAHLIPL
ncbi:MAG: LysE family transporter [Candidatus Nezhaarchaeales archaeon]